MQRTKKKGSQTDVAKHLDLSQARVSQLIKDGFLPSAKPRAGYDLDVYRIAYIRYLRGQATGQIKTGEVDEDGKNYTLLLEKEKFRKEKRENDIAEKLVAPVSLLVDALEKAGAQIIPILESLPLIMKRHWPEITGDEIQLVKKSIAECRNIISTMQIEIDE